MEPYAGPRIASLLIPDSVTAMAGRAAVHQILGEGSAVCDRLYYIVTGVRAKIGVRWPLSSS